MPTKEQLQSALINADKAGDMNAAKQLANALKNYSEPAQQKPVEAGFRRAALQGATFGAGDELAAGITAGLSKAGEKLGIIPDTGQSLSEIYQSELAKEQQRMEQYREQSPKTALAAELAGGLLTGGAGASRLAGLKGIQSLRPAAQAAVIGGTEGATYGYLSGKPGERGESAAIGGVGGAIGAPALQLAGSVGRNLGAPVVDRIRNAISGTPASDARNYLAAGLAKEGITDVAERLPQARGGEMATLADVSEAARGQLEGLVSDASSPAIKAMAKEALTQRNRAQQSRLFDLIDQDLQTTGRTFRETIGNLRELRSDTAGPLYDEARNKSLQTTPYLKAILDPERGVPEVLDAFKTAQRRVATKRAAGDKVSNIDVIDEAKRVMDDDIKALYRQGKNNRARDLVRVKNKMLQDVDDQIPEYKAARNAFAGESALINAAEEGSQILRKDVDYLDDIIQGMSDSEKGMFRIGAKKAIREKLMQARQGTNSINRISSEINLERMKRAFPDQQSFNRFKDDLKFEASIFETERVLHNSMTALRQSEQKALDKGIDFEVPDNIGRNMSEIAANGIRRLLKKELSPEARIELGRLILTPISELPPNITERINKTIISMLPEQNRTAARKLFENISSATQQASIAAPGVAIGATE